MAATTRNKKTAAEKAAIRKGGRITAEYKRIIAEEPGKYDKIVTMGTGKGEVQAKVRESGAERMARESEMVDREWRNAKIADYKKAVREGKMKIGDVPTKYGIREAVSSELNVKPLEKKAKAETKAKPKFEEKPKVQSPDEIKAGIDKKAKAAKAPAAPGKKGASSNKKNAPAAPESSGTKAAGKKSGTATSATPSGKKTGGSKVAAKAPGKELVPAGRVRVVSGREAIAVKGKPKFTQKLAKVASKAVNSETAAALGKLARVSGRAAGVFGVALSAKDVADTLTDKKKLAGAFKARGAIMDAAAGKMMPQYQSASTGAGIKTKTAVAKTKIQTSKNAGRRVSADRADSSRGAASAAANVAAGRVTKPIVKPVGPTSTSTSGKPIKGAVTVKRGDTLWGIARDNSTTVDALLKANPTLAKRKAAGKTVLFSNTKVRIPKK